MVDEVSTKRSTWRRWNLRAAAAKQTMGWRFRTAADREAVVGLIVDAAEGKSVALTPPELAVSPVDFRREDGTSVFRPRHSTVYSSTEVMAAGDRLLARGEERAAPALELEEVASALEGDVARGCLSHEQADAIARGASSGRRLDLLVDPAGDGKTTAMPGCAKRGAPSVEREVSLASRRPWPRRKPWRRIWGSSVTTRPSGCTSTTAATSSSAPGQLVIIDEAILADTRTLDRLGGLAATAGAKVLLSGDDAQLQSVNAGGAFSLLAEVRGSDVSELTEIHRFTQEWEKQATAGLRRGEVEVVGTYAGTAGLGRARPIRCSTRRTPPGAMTSGAVSTAFSPPKPHSHALNARAQPAHRLLASAAAVPKSNSPRERARRPVTS